MVVGEVLSVGQFMIAERDRALRREYVSQVVDSKGRKAGMTMASAVRHETQIQGVTDEELDPSRLLRARLKRAPPKEEVECRFAY